MVWRVLGALVAVMAAGTAAASPAQAPPSLSAFRTLNPPERVSPDDLVAAIERTARHAGVPRAQALHRVRLLRSDVTGLPLYAVKGDRGRVCFLLWRGVGTCGSILQPSDLVWAINGGSRKRGQALVGVASDDVVAVRVRIAGRWHRVTPRHNAFYLPYRQPSLTLARPAVVAITR